MNKKAKNFRFGFSQKTSLITLAVFLITTTSLPIFLQEIKDSKKINNTLDKIGISKSSKQQINNIVNNYLLTDVAYSVCYDDRGFAYNPGYGNCPIVFNLINKNAIEISKLENGIYFDFNGDGFAEKMSWALPEYGVLAADINNNGKIDNSSELLKDDNIKNFDTNNDGIIDKNDDNFAILRIFKNNGNLSTLSKENITAIILKAKEVLIVDKNGNKKVKEGNYKYSDGKTGFWEEFLFITDTADSLELNLIKETPSVAKLPNIKNKGIVHSLHQAMLRDNELQKLVEEFIKEQNPQKRQPLLQQIIYQWTGVSEIKENARGKFINAKHLVVTEKFAGREFGAEYDVNTGKRINAPKNPEFFSAPAIETSYKEIENWIYAELMSQTHLYSLAKEIKFKKGKYDFTNVVQKLDKELKTNPKQGKELIYDFARMIKGLGLDKQSNFLDPKDENCFYLKFTTNDRDLKWKIDTINTIYFDTKDKIIDKADLSIGTFGADAYKTPIGKEGRVHALKGNDVLYGAELNDTFVGCKGDDILDGGDGDDWLDGFYHNDIIFGGKGNDIIHAGGGDDIVFGGDDDDTIYLDYNEPGDEKEAGNDICIGGRGNDIIYSEVGDDTFIFNLGDGQDIIFEKDGNDTLFFGKNIKWKDLIFVQDNRDMVIKIKNTNDQITIKDWFVEQKNGINTRIENFEFADGTKYTEKSIKTEKILH